MNMLISYLAALWPYILTAIIVVVYVLTPSHPINKVSPYALDGHEFDTKR